MQQTRLRLSENDARKLIEENHQYYFEILRNAAKSYGKRFPKLPEIEISDAVYNACGQYNPATNVCKYSLPYAVYAGEHYKEIVAHEVSHAFTDYFENSPPAHGKTFLFLLRDICGFKTATAFHSYPPRIVREVSETLAAMRGGYVNERPLGFRHGSLAAARNSFNVVRSNTTLNTDETSMKQIFELLRKNPATRLELSADGNAVKVLAFADSEINGERLRFSQTREIPFQQMQFASIELIVPAVEDLVEDLQHSIEGYRAEHER